MAMDEADKAALGDAAERMFSAAKKGDWEEAGAAYYDMHVIVDDCLDAEEGEMGEGEEKGEAEKGGKRPLAAIVIGGPKK